MSVPHALGLIEPKVTKARTGFLAVSPQGSDVMIGVVGDTEEDARSNFAARVEVLREVLARDVRWKIEPS